MVSKCKIKQIYSLNDKKHRQKENLFVIEGIKSINEYLATHPDALYELYTEEEYVTLIIDVQEDKTNIISRAEMKLISRQSTPSGVLALCRLPENKEFIPDNSKLYLALDELRDPGNMGTIIRLCDWFGIKEIIASKGTVDCFNPKVVQASMSSLARVNVHYLDLELFLKNCTLPVYGTFLDGENLYKTNLQETGIIVIGNESNGIGKEVEQLIHHRICIPKLSASDEVESLNAAMASAVVLSEFRSRKLSEHS